MKLWPFGNGKLETRAASSYGDAVIEALVGRAEGRSLAGAGATASLEACSGLVSRAFASCEVAGPASIVQALTPSVMALIGRQLIKVGEAVFLIDTSGTGLKLLPVQSWDVAGDPDPSSWTYRLDLAGPSTTIAYDALPAASCLHFRYAVSPSCPWSANGPIQVAALAGKLSAETSRALAEESSGPVGRLLGLPVDGDDLTVSGLKNDIRDARGRTAIIEAGDWGNAGEAKAALKSERFGADPPAGLVALMSAASQEVYAACGLNAALWGGAGGAGATREAWRLALFSVLAPLGKLVESELRDKLDDEVSLSWQELRASDLSGRARAFQSMVGGGMSVTDAVSVAGLMVED